MAAWGDETTVRPQTRSISPFLRIVSGDTARAPAVGTSQSSGGAKLGSKAAITLLRSHEEVRRLWNSPEYPHEYIDAVDASVTFRDAPGDRGTEIHVELERGAPRGKLREAVQKVVGSASLAKVKDDLRRFKQRAETGELPRSEGTPEGERAERKLKQHPAQPLKESELEKAGL